MILDLTSGEKKGIPTRYLILLMIFVVTTVNYGDHVTSPIAGTKVAKELGLSAVSMGCIFFVFGWVYLLIQIPGGWLLDKSGPKKVYSYSLFFWSLFTFLRGLVDVFPLAWIGVSMFFMRLMPGFSETFSFPANARIVTAWFPAKERGIALAIFNAAQYLSLVLFSPLLGWLIFALGWEYVFIATGIIEFVLTIIWVRFVHNPTDHPRMSMAELKYISEGGAVVDMDHKKETTQATGLKMDYIRQLLTNRMMLGVFFGQYLLNTITWSFLMQFLIYLVQGKGMSTPKVGFVVSILALFGFAGGALDGLFSNYLIGRDCTLTFARKLPIVLGMLLASSIILCNYMASTPLVVTLMTLAFFGKGFDALGWPTTSDVASREIVGLCGGVFNVFSNVASIATPLVIGYIISELHSPNDALIFVGGSTLMMMVCYLLVVGDIKHMESQK